jgi:hypothetical protein
MCDTSGWGAFKVTYEGCCVINTGTILRVDQGDGRGRYAGAWWEWDCGLREANEVVVGIVEREEKERGKEKKERKKKNVDKVNGAIWEKMGAADSTEKAKSVEDVLNETRDDLGENEEDRGESQDDRGETQMEDDPDFDEDMVDM